MSRAPASPLRPPHSPKLAPLSPAIAFCPSSSLTTQNSSGASLDDFQIIRCLGRGSSSRVFLVRLLRPELLTNPLSPPAHLSSLNLSNTELPPVFALKVISKNDVVMRNRVKRVFTEHSILQQSTDHFIVRLYLSFHTPNYLLLLLEFCGGGELFRLAAAQQQHRLAEQYVRFYTAEVLHALLYLHSIGFAYRDLKPENILISSSGHIRLADFDLSSPIAPTPLGASLQRRSFVGTPEYVSPEVVDGSGTSAAVDFWSFGVLLYEMTFGHTPFAGASMQDTFANIVSKELKFPSKHSASRELVDLIRRLLVKDPTRRLVGDDVKSHAFFSGVNWSDLTAAAPPLVPTLETDDDSSYFPSVHDDAVEAAMLEELSHERCHEGNPFFALSCRESGVIVASPMLRPQGAAQQSRRRLIGDSVGDLDPHALLRELADRDTREKELLLRIDSERARADAAEWRLKLMETRQEGSRKSGSSGDGHDAESSCSTMSSAELIDSPWQTSSSLAFLTISDMWSEVVLAAIEDNVGWQSERDNGPITSHTRTFSWSKIPCRKGRMTVRASHDVVADVMREIGTPLKHLTKHTAPHFEETLEVVVQGDWGFISVVHQRHHIPLYGFKERDFVLLHTFKKLEDVSGQRAHVVIAGFVAKPLDGVILRSSAPFLRNAKTTGLWFISQIDLKGYMPHWLTCTTPHSSPPLLLVLNCAARYYITDGMEDTMLRICSESERVGSEDAAASVLQQRLSRRSTPGDRSPPQHSSSSTSTPPLSPKLLHIAAPFAQSASAASPTPAKANPQGSSGGGVKQSPKRTPSKHRGSGS